MVYGNTAQVYQKTKIETADHLELVIMCYDAAIKDLESAKELQSSQSIDGSQDKIRHAQDIITELLVALDYERGGIIAQNLSRLYNFILRQLIGIHSRQDLMMYDHIIHILSELKDAWEQVHRSPAHSTGTPARNLNWSMSV